jgi:transposase
MTELVLAGRGVPFRDQDMVLTELTAWAAHLSVRGASRTATRTSCSVSSTVPSRT